MRTVCLILLLLSLGSSGSHGQEAPAAGSGLSMQFARLLSIKVTGGPEARLIEAKPGKWEGNLIIFLHDAQGLSQQTASRVEALARQTGAAVICPELYAASAAPDSARILEIMRSCVDYGGKSCRIQLLSWGGPASAFVLLAAAINPDRFYGAVLLDGLPDPDSSLVAQLQGPLLLLRNKDAKSLSGSKVVSFSGKLQQQGKVFKSVEYVSATASAVPGGRIVQSPDKQSWSQAIDFLKLNFQAPMRRAEVAKP